VTQIAVKLPDALVHELEDVVAQGVFPNRSSAVRHAVEAIVARQRQDVIERAYSRGWCARCNVFGSAGNAMDSTAMSWRA
jgi:Arc/MetJ-type ribon-helix-helix transcriptional regulator